MGFALSDLHEQIDQLSNGEQRVELYKELLREKQVGSRGESRYYGDKAKKDHYRRRLAAQLWENTQLTRFSYLMNSDLTKEMAVILPEPVRSRFLPYFAKVQDALKNNNVKKASSTLQRLERIIGVGTVAPRA